MQHSWRRRLGSVGQIVLPFVLAGLVAVAVVCAGEVTLKDGTVLRGAVESPTLLRGEIEPTVGFVRVDDGLRRVLFHTKQLAHANDAPPLETVKPFLIPQPLGGRNEDQRIENLIAIEDITPFDEFGRRTFVVRDKKGSLSIPQGITEINPYFVRVQSLRHNWESSIGTPAVPAATLEAILRRNINSKRVDDRLRLARFFIAAEWYVQADKELKAIQTEFADVADQAREADEVLQSLKARRRLREIKLRRGAGQHGFAYQELKAFPPDGAPGDVLTEVRDLLKEYEAIVERMQRVQREIERLRGECKNAEALGKLTTPLREVAESVHVENIARLDSFLASAGNSQLSPEDRLAAAVSGWVAGNAFAETNLDRALRLWEGRAKIIEYLKEPNDARRRRLLDELRGQEIISVDLAANVIEQLPPLVQTDGLAADKPTRLRVGGDGGDVAYWVLLPPAYNPYRRYPVIVTLHGAGETAERQVAWWSAPPGFQASRHGYIVVAPEYVDDPKKGYRFDVPAHNAVLFSLIDVRQRFSVDSDRVFLTGHSMGGHAAWDIGLAHPDLFAGVIPICGSPQFYCEHYWQNGENTSFYIVDGEKNGGSPDVNQRVLKRMMETGQDAQYVEFRGRGHENFSDEILRIFDWMSRKTRRKLPLTFSCRSSRATDNDFYWLSVSNFDEAVLMDPRVFDRKKIKTAQIDGKITATATSNAIAITVRGARSAELWISPKMDVNLDQPLTVRVNGDMKHRKVVTLDLETLLEDFRLRADRQKLFYAKMSFERI
jgi:pimeloyl-ACP methyl ester carboxylesterase